MKRRVNRPYLKPGPKPGTRLIKNKLTDEQTREAAHRLAGGELVKVVYLDLGCDPKTLRRSLKRLGANGAKP